MGVLTNVPDHRTRPHEYDLKRMNSMKNITLIKHKKLVK